MKKWFRMVSIEKAKGSQVCDPFAAFLKTLKEIFMELLF